MRQRNESDFYLNVTVASLSFAAVMAVIAAPLWRLAF
jgi:hypothetical protein